MASSWQTSHFVVVIGAAGLAFAAGYTMGGNRARPTEVPIVNNVAAPAFPGLDGNQAEAQPPPTRRGRPDENELIAANAEPEDGQPQQPAAAGGRETPRGGRDADRRRGRDEPVEQPPQDEGYQQEEQDPYGPEGE